jgi:protein tyrosine phosphatase (PTP) superfamily phosphohydrolase (DUF442 family)
VGRILLGFHPRSRRIAAFAVAVAAAVVLGMTWNDLFEKRVTVVVPGKVVRGAWQRPGPLRTIVDREKIRTIVTLTAINADDPKYVDQARVVREAGVRWIIVPMRGSRATLGQMAETADLLADPALQPVFFHCVAGHHRSSLAQAAYRIRHDGWSAQRAWEEVAELAWARPTLDSADRRLIEAFAASEFAEVRPGRDGDHETRPTAEMDRPLAPPDPDAGLPGRRVELRHGQLRDDRAGAGLSVRADARLGTRADGPRPPDQDGP